MGCCNPPPTCFFSTSCCCWWITYLLTNEKKSCVFTLSHIHTWKPTFLHFKNTIQSNPIQSNPFEIVKIVTKRYHHRSHHIMDLRFVENLVHLGLVSPCIYIYIPRQLALEGFDFHGKLAQFDSSPTFNNINWGKKNFHSQMIKRNWHSQTTTWMNNGWQSLSW